MIYKLVSYMPNLRELDFDKDLVNALVTLKMKTSESSALNQAGEDDKLKPTMTVILDDNRKQVVPVQLH